MPERPCCDDPILGSVTHPLIGPPYQWSIFVGAKQWARWGQVKKLRDGNGIGECTFEKSGGKLDRYKF